MFTFRETHDLDPGRPRVEVAFTDASIDLQGERPAFAATLEAVVEATGVPFARLHQVHGADVVVIDETLAARLAEPVGDTAVGDALVTTRRGTGLMIRAADCVPVLLADQRAGIVGAVHAGRAGIALDVIGQAVERMRALGAGELRAWIGPHVCGRCYEVPAPMREEVAAVVPATYAETSRGTPALDLGAGAEEQLRARGVDAARVGGCTLEDPRLHSYRRDGAAAGRLAGLVWLA
ncbi:polyphenol oxidase family protein [Nocardioides sp.]|uniref:polyphenol oxidase family protein n=1 Tax=Nocardioides sp. TaxID=35761 RepID=UPI0039E68F16